METKQKQRRDWKKLVIKRGQKVRGQSAKYIKRKGNRIMSANKRVNRSEKIHHRDKDRTSKRKERERVERDFNPVSRQVSW